MTCATMGGPCDHELSGNTMEELAANGTKHLQETHPDMAKDMDAMSQEAKDKWMTDLKVKWDAAPDA